MKKIDLHIHTVVTCSDREFEFSLDKLKQYVEESGLHAIAVTNHNVFDGDQYRTIRDAIAVPVFPGIEINLCSCHLLLISDGACLEDFEAKCSKVAVAISKATDSISIEELKEYFGDLNDYLLIPHYAKKPAIDSLTLSEIIDFVSAGEVDSAKKFNRAIKDDKSLSPVLFSDERMRPELDRLPTRQTFIDCGDVSLSAIKTCLKDKGKIALSEQYGNRLFQVFPDGQMVSTGMNILLGERSSGKSFFLNQIYESHANVKYIRQFSLVKPDEIADAKEFDNDVERRRSCYAENYLTGFKSVVDDMMKVDNTRNDQELENYVATLLNSAEEADRRDSFSRAVLFDETSFSVSSDRTLKDLIGSVRQLIENIDHRDVIERHVDLADLRRLACELIKSLWVRTLLNKKKQLVNELVADVKRLLEIKSSAVPVADVDLYDIALTKCKVKRFEAIVRGLRQPAVISRESVQGFSVVAEKGPYLGAGELSKACGVKTALSDSMRLYNSPFEYLHSLKQKEGLKPAGLYRLFAKITFKILNKDGCAVSGGERSEYRLLHEIKDAQSFEMLLLDEPESSFDNIFLHSNVNELLRSLSRSMPVIIATHSSTVGASAGADYLLYASKSLENQVRRHRVYSGYPTDPQLSTCDGACVANHLVLMNSLEAGVEAYEQRKKKYEALKD